jgi:trehalose-6-phosphate synthase
MRVEERRERWLAMIDKLKSASVQIWFSDFVRALAEVRRTTLPVATRSNVPVPFSRTERSIAQTR